MAIVKAKLCGMKDGQTVSEMEVRFNPEKYVLTSSNDYSSKQEPNHNKTSNQMQSLGAYSQTFSTDLVFDTYDKKVSVKKYTYKLDELIKQGDGSGSSLYSCKFIWGEFIFEGVVTSLTQTFTMFMDDGKPVRATVAITIKGSKNAPQHTETVDNRDFNHDDTRLLDSKYDEPGLWRIIAEAQMTDNPRL